MSHSIKESSVKYTAIYRCPDDITNLKIRITIKEIENSDSDSPSGGWEQQTFPWQRKVFSKSEREFYSDEKNCVTDLEKKYHKDVAQVAHPAAKIDLYSYVNEDEFTLANSEKNLVGSETQTQTNDEESDHEFDLKKSVLDARARPLGQHQEWDIMLIMADLGEYIETTWIKCEKTLCTIKFDQKLKILSVYPDFTKNLTYKLKIEGNAARTFYYYVENVSEQISEDDSFKEKELIRKVTNLTLTGTRQMLDVTFVIPPKNKLRVYLFFEILSAREFEYDEIFVQYFIDLPTGWSCESPDNLQGVTQTCHTKSEDGLAHFGHVFELVLDYNIENLKKSGFPPNPYIYFEVISKDVWDRYRTEGLAYKNLPVGKPGNYRYDLQCFRLIPDGVSGQLRRFFLGDYKNYNDLTWIGLPTERASDSLILNKYGTNTVGTGQMSVRLNVVHQSQAFLEKFSENPKGSREIFEKLNASSLVRSVEQVLLAFKRARRNMIEARNKIN